MQFYIALFILPLKITASCNGSPQLCDRLFNETIFLTTHNSFAIGSNPAANQELSIAQQLNDGVRGISLDLHNFDPSNPNGDISLCHYNCALLYAGPLINTLTVIKKFLDDNSKEIVTIFIENFGHFSVREIGRAFVEAKLGDMAYFKNPFDPWLTHNQMANMNKRILIYVGFGDPDADYPWVIREWDLCWETPYNYEYRLSPFSCRVDRPFEGLPAGYPMYVLNHFVFTTFGIGGSAIPTPNPLIAADVNGDSLETHINNCIATTNKRPNYIAVDFYNNGRAKELVAKLNNVPLSNANSVKSNIILLFLLSISITYE